MWVITSIDYHTLLGQTPILYSLSVAVLTALAEPGAHKREGTTEAGSEAIPRSSFFERKMLARQNPMNK